MNKFKTPPIIFVYQELLSDIYDYLGVENEGVDSECYALCERIRELIGHTTLISMTQKKDISNDW